MLALNGGLHDAAIAAWNHKGFYDSARPISFIRYMGQLGQSSDPEPQGRSGRRKPRRHLSPEWSAARAGAGRSDHARNDGAGPAARASGRPRGQDRHPRVAGCHRRRRAVRRPSPKSAASIGLRPRRGCPINWQASSRRRSQVMSRATRRSAARRPKCWRSFTGSEFFPGGIFEYDIPLGSGLDFEYGPSQAVKLQCATYFDASDQASISRIYGGIHPPADDFPGRRIGNHGGPRCV